MGPAPHHPSRLSPRGPRQSLVWALTLSMGLVAGSGAAADRGSGGAAVGDPLRCPATMIRAILPPATATGSWWVASEDYGLHERGADGRWVLHGTPPPLWDCDQKRGDHAKVAGGLGGVLCLLADRSGRLWTGLARSGVQVRGADGAWRHLPAGSGPLGERVTAIAEHPSGEVWIASNAGLSRWLPGSDTWEAVPCAPAAGHAGAVGWVVFTRNGRAVVAGEAWGVAVQGYPGRSDRWLTLPLPAEPRLDTSEATLPTSSITGLAIDVQDRLWIATAAGLAMADAAGPEPVLRAVLRGPELATRRELRRASLPPGTLAIDPARLLLPEEYVANVRCAADGLVWLGFREHGVRALDPATGRLLPISSPAPAADGRERKDTFVMATANVPEAPDRVAIGAYGQGFDLRTVPATRAPAPAAVRPAALTPAPAAPGPALPSPWRVDAAAIEALRREIASAPRDAGRGLGVWPAGRDAATRGDWLGRYGRHWSVNAATYFTVDYVWGAGREPIDYVALMGPERDRYDSLRYWIQWNATDAPESMELPAGYAWTRVDRKLAKPHQLRRQAEWDDHGETYPTHPRGPDVTLTLRIPAGAWMLGLYNWNKDGAAGGDEPNLRRDYRLLYRLNPDTPLADGRKVDYWSWSATAAGVQSVYSLPILAKDRMWDFRASGTWFRSVVRGPGTLTVHVDRQHSYNAILAGAMLDPLDAYPEPYLPWRARSVLTAATAPSAAAWRLLADLDRLTTANPGWWAAHHRRIARAVLLHLAEPASSSDLAGRDRDHALAIAAWAAHDWPTYEAALTRLGVPTPRAVERAIRWDGQAFTNCGWGRIRVQQKLAELGVAPHPPAPHRPNHPSVYDHSRQTFPLLPQQP